MLKVEAAVSENLKLPVGVMLGTDVTLQGIGFQEMNGFRRCGDEEGERVEQLTHPISEDKATPYEAVLLANTIHWC